MLTTSMSAVVAPPFFNFATPLLHDAKNLRHFARRNPVILRHLDARLKPHLDLAVRRIDVDVHSILFEREEVEAVPAFAKYGRTHRSDRTSAIRSLRYLTTLGFRARRDVPVVRATPASRGNTSR